MTHATHAVPARGDDALPEPQVAPLVHAIATTPVPTQPGSDQYDDAAYSEASMMRAHVYRLAHDDLGSHYQTELALDDGVGEAFGFEETPSHNTLSRAWRERFSKATRNNIESLAELLGSQIDSPQDLGNVRPQPEPEWPEQDLPGVPDVDRQEKDRAYRRVRPVLHEVIDFDRGPNASVPAETLTEFASYLSRRNTFAEQGSERFRAEHDDAEVFSPETFRRAVRNKEREKMRLSTDDTIWTDPQDWSVTYNDEYGETDDWHGATEEAIDRLVSTLKDEGVIDGPVPVCIDGSVREWHKHPDGADTSPIGVYQETRFSTNYAYKDMSATAVIGDRTIVLGNVSRVPGDKFFKAVKYLVDRARDLVDVELFLADAEFANTDVCRYIETVGEDYIMKKPHRGRVKDFLGEASGNADYTEFEMRSPRKGIQHNTTLFAVEKRGKIGTKKGVKRSETTDQTSLGDYGSLSGQTSFDDYSGDEEIERVAFVTNREIDGVGIDPKKNPVAHDPDGTVWGCAAEYRRRWAIETAFRQVKYQFLGKTTSRDLGVRRFFWSLALILYNSWAVMNLLVQEWVPHVEGDRPPVRAKVFLEVLARDTPPD